MKNIINWSIITILALAVAGTFYAEKSARFKAPDSDTPTSTGSGLEPKNGTLDILLDDLAYCESTGRDNFRIVDSNGWYSYSTYQFQMPTWKAYAAEVFLEADDADLENLIWGGEDQRKVAKYMLESNPENWRHWRTCGKLVGLNTWANEQNI